MTTECKRCGKCCHEFFLPPLNHMHEPPLWVRAMLMNIESADVTDCDDEPCMFFMAELDDASAECVIHDKTWRPSICQRFSCEGRCDGMDSREEAKKPAPDVPHTDNFHDMRRVLLGWQGRKT